MKLTLPQQDIYSEQQLYPGEAIYNIGAKIKIKGEIDSEVFNLAYTNLIKQHDSYRTIFSNDQQEVSTRIVAKVNELKHIDYSHFEDAERKAEDFVQNEFLKPFNITSGKGLYKFALIKISEDLHYLFTVCHHIITDGWGTSLMFQRLVQNYNEILKTGSVVSNYPYSYSDFSFDDAKYQTSKEYDTDKSYWKENFNKLPKNPFKQLSIDHGSQSGRKTLSIKREKYDALINLAKSYRASTFHLFLALLYIYFGRKHECRDFAIGLPVLNRSKFQYKKTVGLFMGVSPLRVKLNFKDTLEHLIKFIKDQLRRDYRHQRFPVGKLIQSLRKSQTVENLYNITLSYEKQDYSDHFDGTTTTVIPLTHQAERVALAVYIREFDRSEDVKVDFDYNKNFFNDITASQLTIQINELINSVLKKPNDCLYKFNYIPCEEQNEILGVFNDTFFELPQVSIIELFNNQKQSYPTKVAVSDRSHKFSFSELDLLSNQIAEFLQSRTELESSKVVGLCLERSCSTIAVMLGVLKAGKSFIPLDPFFPEKRLKYIINHSSLDFIISDQTKYNFEDVIEIDRNYLMREVRNYNGKTISNIRPSDTAYTIYTSGTTGRPKGVEISHRSLTNFLLSMQQKPGIKDSDTFFAVTTYSFDISILELFGPLISGASVYVASNESLADPKEIIQLLEKTGSTIIQATPSFYQLLFNSGWKGNKNIKILCGGDVLNENLAGQLLASCKELWNMYGPTETTIWSSVKKLTNPKESSIIGKPIFNTRFYVLDTFLQLLPKDISGSLYIGGAGLAKGYHKKDNLYKEKFITNPFHEGLIYETGDEVKWNQEGEIVFIGRNDQQVKIRGYRIELGEVENRLNELTDIEQAVVIAKKDNSGNNVLIAFFTSKVDVEISQLRSELQAVLPVYMIPSLFIRLVDFPLTPNQKIDRSALHRLNEKDLNSSNEKPPITKSEKKLARIWTQVLDLKKIGINDNFFAIGGHSLNAVKLVNQINNELNYSIDLKALFDFPTISSLSNYLSKLKNVQPENIPLCPRKEFYATTPSQHEIWLASQNMHRSVAYNMATAFHLNGYIDHKKLDAALNKILKRHEILRANFFEINGKIYQKFQDNFYLKIPVEKLRGGNLAFKLQELIQKPFDFESELLIRVNLLQKTNSNSILVFNMHHIIMDGWSLETLTKEFITYYNDDIDSEEQKNDNCLQFKDYAEWYNSSFQEKDRLFWRNYLENYNFKNSFPPDNEPHKPTYSANHDLLEFDKSETESIKKFTKKKGITIHNFLVTALNILIYRLNHNEDIIVGTINSGRGNSELTEMIGMFAKTLPLRTKISQKDTFDSVQDQVQKGVLELQRNSFLPFDYRKHFQIDVLMVFQSWNLLHENPIELKDVEMIPYPLRLPFSRVPILMNFFEQDNLLKANISSNSQMYRKESIDLIILKFKKVAKEIIESPKKRLGDLDMELEFEKQNSVDFKLNF